MKRFLRIVLLPLLVTLGAAASLAGDCPPEDREALGWLEKMSHSLSEVNYEGVVTLQRGKDMQVIQVTHSVDEGTTFESLTELTGSGGKVERAGHPLDCLHPGTKLLRSARPGDTGHCGVAEQYRLGVAEGERVAGRKAVRITIQPRDVYRFGHVLALDQETGLLLKAQTVKHGNRVIETMQFAHLSYHDPVPQGEAQVVRQAHHPAPVPASQGASVQRPWRVQWLPRGFTSTGQTLGTGARRTYTDGLAVFSIFLEDLDKAIRPGEGVIRSGSTTTYTRGMSLDGQPVLVTVIGEVPANTARMVADSVSWAR